MTVRKKQEVLPVVYVIDDDVSIRDGLGSLLGSMGLKVEVFASPQAFLDARRSDGPACLVLDVRLPGVSGLDFQGELVRQGIRCPVVFITGHGDIPMTVRAMKAGAIEFLAKPFRDQELLDAVQIGLNRDMKRIEEEEAAAGMRARLDNLTAREREIFGYVTSGLMNKQVAGELGVSEITVKIHRGNVMRKMGARSLAELVRMADQLDIRRPET